MTTGLHVLSCRPMFDELIFSNAFNNAFPLLSAVKVSTMHKYV